MAEQIRQILMQEQDHPIDLATALGEKVLEITVAGRISPKTPVLPVYTPPGTRLTRLNRLQSVF
jgi:hypothetical protein